jgi:hypothetical protein
MTALKWILSALISLNILAFIPLAEDSSQRMIRLQLIAMSDANWDASEFSSRMERTQDILTQCGINISYDIKMIKNVNDKIDFYPSRRNLRGQGAFSVAEAHDTEDESLIRIFYIGDILSTESAGQSFPSVWVPPQSPLLNTIFLARSIMDNDYYDRGDHQVDRNYLPEPHEIIHLLTNEGHDDSGVVGIMSSEPDLLSPFISTELCQKMVTSPLVN